MMECGGERYTVRIARFVNLIHFLFKPGLTARRMVTPLQITSCLFASVVLHAYYLECTVYHHIFLLVTVFSVWFHGTHHPWVAVADKIIAHVAFTVPLFDIPMAVRMNRTWLVAFPLGAALLWLSETLFKEHRDSIHLWLHLTSIVGLHCFLSELYQVQ
jgi:hypothetical protein